MKPRSIPWFPSFLFAVFFVAGECILLAAPNPSEAPPALELPGTSPALPLRPLKIGFVDIDAVTEKSLFVRRMLDTLEKQIREKQESLLRKKEEYANLRSEIEQKRPALTEEKIQEMIRRSVELGASIENEDYAFREFFRMMEKERMGPAFDRVLGAIRRLAVEEDFDLILRGEVVLFGKPALNLTEKVILQLDREEVTTGTLNPPAPPSPENAAGRKTPPAPGKTKTR